MGTFWIAHNRKKEEKFKKEQEALNQYIDELHCKAKEIIRRKEISGEPDYLMDHLSRKDYEDYIVDGFLDQQKKAKEEFFENLREKDREKLLRRRQEDIEYKYRFL